MERLFGVFRLLQEFPQDEATGNYHASLHGCRKGIEKLGLLFATVPASGDGCLDGNDEEKARERNHTRGFGKDGVEECYEKTT